MFTNQDNIIDSRDVIERIEELESEIESLNEYIAEARSEIEEIEESLDTVSKSDDAEAEAGLESEKEALEDKIVDLEGDITELQEELTPLLNLQNEAEGYSPDWIYGATLIKDDYFEEYAQELAEDIGAIQRDAQWPNNHIDWEAAANELKLDYTEVDYDGETYWIR